MLRITHRLCENAKTVISSEIKKSQMTTKKCFKIYFDEACPERSRRAQYDKTGIFTKSVSVTGTLKSVILSDAPALYRRMKPTNSVNLSLPLGEYRRIKP